MKFILLTIISAALLTSCCKLCSNNENNNTTTSKSFEKSNEANQQTISDNVLQVIADIPSAELLDVFKNSEILAPALAEAKAENKHVIIDFTGSDWCGWCIKLDKEIFDTEDYKNGIASDFIFVKIDFPRNIQQPNELEASNRELAKHFNIKGFPTIIIVDANGNKVGQTGYIETTPAGYVEHLKSFINK